VVENKRIIGKKRGPRRRRSTRGRWPKKKKKFDLCRNLCMYVCMYVCIIIPSNISVNTKIIQIMILLGTHPKRWIKFCTLLVFWLSAGTYVDFLKIHTYLHTLVGHKLLVFQELTKQTFDCWS
jgi:hypothetical protein